MTNLYLIAHKVRSEPAFDVAQRIECAECLDLAGTNYGCNECDQLGYWWIIPTSGHRAYPWHYWPWDELYCDSRRNPCEIDPVEVKAPPMPPDLPDHYPHAAHNAPKRDLLAALGLNRKPSAPTAPFPRRI